MIRTTRVFAGLAGLTVVACLFSGAARNNNDEVYRQRLVGTWTGKFFGSQVLTNHADGTAHLEVTLNRLGALRYGRSLQIELEWTVHNGVLEHQIVRGSPPEKVARLVRDWGKTLEYEIVEVTQTHMLLEKPNDDKPQRWEAQN